MRLKNKGFDMTLEEVTKVLKTLHDYDERLFGYLMDDINDSLDGLLEDDEFGTEGQNDPRGDKR